jgi:hypothetical protein
MTNTELLKAWRAEIARELEQASSEIKSPLDEERKSAIAAAERADEASREMQKTLRSIITDRPPGLPNASLAGPLALRVNDHKAECEATASKRARTHNAYRAAQIRVTELESALGQLDRLLAHEEETAS